VPILPDSNFKQFLMPYIPVGERNVTFCDKTTETRLTMKHFLAFTYLCKNTLSGSKSYKWYCDSRKGKKNTEYIDLIHK